MASKKIVGPVSGPKSFTGPKARAQESEVPESGPKPTVDDMSDSEISIPKATKAELEMIQRQLEDFRAQHQRSTDQLTEMIRLFIEDSQKNTASSEQNEAVQPGEFYDHEEDPVLEDEEDLSEMVIVDSGDRPEGWRAFEELVFDYKCGIEQRSTDTLVPQCMSEDGAITGEMGSNFFSNEEDLFDHSADSKVTLCSYLMESRGFSCSKLPPESDQSNGITDVLLLEHGVNFQHDLFVLVGHLCPECEFCTLKFILDSYSVFLSPVSLCCGNCCNCIYLHHTPHGIGDVWNFVFEDAESGSSGTCSPESVPDFSPVCSRRTLPIDEKHIRCIRVSQFSADNSWKFPLINSPFAAVTCFPIFIGCDRNFVLPVGSSFPLGLPPEDDGFAIFQSSCGVHEQFLKDNFPPDGLEFSSTAHTLEGSTGEQNTLLVDDFIAELALDFEDFLRGVEDLDDDGGECGYDAGSEADGDDEDDEDELFSHSCHPSPRRRVRNPRNQGQVPQ